MSQEAINQLRDSMAINDRIVRVLKKGFYPASVGGDVQASIDYLKRLNKLWQTQIAGIKAMPKVDPAKAVDVSTEVTNEPASTENA